MKLRIGRFSPKTTVCPLFIRVIDKNGRGWYTYPKSGRSKTEGGIWVELDLHDIQGMIPGIDYIRGMQYYRRGCVQGLQWKREDGISRVCCRVQGSKLYRVSFWEVRDREFDGVCDCPRFADLGVCKHLAAAMIAYAMDSPKMAPPITDRFARELLRTYLDKSRFVPVPGQGDVRLVPQIVGSSLHWSGYPDLCFRVGKEKLYVVKDIKAFLRNVEERKTTSYGKALTLDHSIENFDTLSRAWIELLMDQFEEFRSHGRHYVPYGYDRPGYQKNQISLTGTAFDRAFQLLQQGEAKTYDGTILWVAQEDPRVCIDLEKETDRAYLNVETEKPYRFFGNGRVLYAQSRETLLQCSEEFRERVYPLLEQEQARMQLALEDLPSFCSCVLPQVRDLVTVDDPGGLLQEYLPEDCTPCFYFDMEGERLTAQLVFRYADRQIKAGTPVSQSQDIKRDVRTEQVAAASIRKFFQEEQGGFFLEGEDAVFSFLTEELDSFHRYGEVYISDRLRGKKIAPSDTGVGISVSDGMLVLELDTGEFPAQELEALYQSLLRRKKYHRLADGRYLELDGSGHEKLAEMSHMLQLSPKDLQKGKVALPAFRALYLDSVLGGSEGLRVTRDREFRAMIRKFRSVEESDYKLPAELEGVLRPYQRVGFQWLKTLESCGFGGILADEMGLGKTLQVIAYLASVDRQKVGCPSLVVCPASLILNWGEELGRFAPQLRCALILGNAAERKAQREAAGDMDVWVTSYELLRQDVEDYQKCRFYCCVLDEGQHIKNQSTLASKAMKKIDCRQRFVLTGTPIENRLSELWNLFDFLMPGYLYSHTAFRDKLEKPIVKTKDQEASAQLRKLVQPFLLRRLKQDVLRELPPKIEHVRRIALSEEERRVYLSAVQAAKASLGEGQGKIQILAALTRLRQICCDPDLCFENYGGRSSKLEACLELCAGMTENGHQILLFSQFTSMLDRIRVRLDEMGISSFTLQGSTPKEKRAQLVKAFNMGKASVFLISLKAGGTGLNLTAADVVIHFDPWWNLAAQDQATDRAHRIGQKAHVQVYKLIAKDTIEEKILDLQDKKAALMDAISGETEGSILTMTQEELLALLG